MGNKPLIVVILFAFFLRGASAFAADVQANWNCAQTNPASRPMPQEGMFKTKLTWNNGKLEMNPRIFGEFIQKALSSKHDYFYCIQYAVNDFKKNAEGFCATGATAEARKDCSDKVGGFVSSLNNQNKASDDKLSISIPGESSSQPFDSYYEQSSKKVCVLHSSQMTKEYVESSLGNFLKELDPECKKSTIESAVMILSSQYSSACRTPDSELCKRLTTSLPPLLNRLNVSLDKPVPGLCLQSSQLPKEIRRLRDTLNDANRCAPLKVGEPPRIINYLSNQRVLGNDYAVTKLDNKSYQIDLKIDFQPIAFGKDKIAPEHMDALKNSLNDCLHAVNTKLKGPNGESLKIRINSDQAPAKLTSAKVAVDYNSPRAVALKWSPFLSCPTMTHEIMHLLGLVDEYKEKLCGFVHDPEQKTTDLNMLERPPENFKKNEFIFAYDCRSIGPENSIMSNHESAMVSAMGEVEYTTCRCDSTEPKGCDYLKELNKDNVYDKCKGITENKSALGVDAPLPPVAKNTRSIVKKKYPPTHPRASILFPAQFRQLIQPNCKTHQASFMECTQGAYDSSVQVKCPEKSEKCKDWKTWLQ